MYKEKEYNKLTNQVRQDFNTKIQPYYIEDKCKLCNSTDNLELHHIVPLSQVVNDLCGLGYDNRLKREIAMGRQINNGFMTVCRNCHRNNPDMSKVHGDKISIALNSKYKKIRKHKNKKMNKKLNVFLPNNLGIRMYPNDSKKYELIKYCNQLDSQHRLQKSFDIIKNFIDTNTDYILLRKRNYSKKDIELFGKTYWILENKPNTSDQQHKKEE